MVENPLVDNKSDHAAASEAVMIDRACMTKNCDVSEYLMDVKDELTQIDRLVSDAVNNGSM